MNNQIDEMARDLAIARNCICKDIPKHCNECTWRVGCLFIEIAKTLDNKGYRRASEVAREIFAELKTVMMDEYRYPIIAELKKKYEVTDDGK